MSKKNEIEELFKDIIGTITDVHTLERIIESYVDRGHMKIFLLNLDLIANKIIELKENVYLSFKINEGENSKSTGISIWPDIEGKTSVEISSYSSIGSSIVCVLGTDDVVEKTGDAVIGEESFELRYMATTDEDFSKLICKTISNAKVKKGKEK